MAKKTPTKKKASSSTVKPKKPVKLAKVAKVNGKLSKSSSNASMLKKTTESTAKTKIVDSSTVKSSIKPSVQPEKSSKVNKSSEKPSLMTKKGKKESPAVDSFEKAEVKKAQTIVSMIEDKPMSEDSDKVEKVGKIKPVKIERGNLADEKAKWSDLNKKFGKDKCSVYKMTESYPAMTALQHKVLGWGYILTNENDRLEVLFENGIRILISNYKS